MPRQKTQKQKIVTRREKQDKELKAGTKVKIDIAAFDRVEAKAKNFAATYKEEDWEPPTYTPDKIALDKENIRNPCEVADRLGKTFKDLLKFHKERYSRLWFVATPDERLEAFYEESMLNRRIVDSYLKQNLEVRMTHAAAVNFVLDYLEDIKLTISRIKTLNERRKVFQCVIDRYEATIEPRPNFEILTVSFKNDSITPEVRGSEPIPEKEMNYRIRQYKAWFFFQYYLHCAPLDKDKRYCKLENVLQEEYSWTRWIPRQMQMPKDGDFRANYKWLLPSFLKSVIQKGGKDSECTKLLSVLPPLSKSQWPKNIKYRPTEYYDIYGGKRNKTVYDVNRPPVSKPTDGPPVSETAEWTPVYEVD